MTAVDLFAGPGGWDVGLLDLGLEPLGIEWDAGACATREAAGLRTLQADVAELDPLGFAPCELLIASPPCQAFSTAGKRGGHRDLAAIRHIAQGLLIGDDRRAAARREMEDPRSLLVVEPLRWALALRPAYVACEQVPPVLPLWQEFAAMLERALGYKTWTGLLSAEQYGVPQTRSRAFLLARLEHGPVRPPAPTHQRYVAMPKLPPQDSLFDAGPRERIVAAGDEALLPWVSMAEALGWGAPARVGFPRRATPSNKPGPDDGEYRERDFRDADEPAFDVTSKARSWRAELAGAPAPTLCGQHTPRWAYRNGNQERAAERAQDEPAPTVAFGHNASGVRVRTGNFSAQSRDAAGRRTKEGSEPFERALEEPSPTLDTAVNRWTLERPAPTLTSTARSDEGGLVGHQLPAGEGRNVGGKNWAGGRPATTVVGKGAVAEPGHKDRGPGSDESHFSGDAVRISIEEAAALQGFPAGYPWQGSRTKRFEQIGNAVCPPVARAVVAALLDLVDPARVT